MDRLHPWVGDEHAPVAGCANVVPRWSTAVLRDGRLDQQCSGLMQTCVCKGQQARPHLWLSLGDGCFGELQRASDRRDQIVQAMDICPGCCTYTGMAHRPQFCGEDA